MEQRLIRLAVLGDISLNGDICRMEPGSWELLPFSVMELFHQLDLVLFNFESPVMGLQGENELKTPRLKTVERTLDNLLIFPHSVATLANNHVYDCLADGFTNTQVALTERGIQSFGAGLSSDRASQPLIIEENGLRIAFFGYVDASTHPSIPPGAEFYVNLLEPEKVLRDMLRVRDQVDHCIVYLHWGLDYFEYPSPVQVKMAHNFIDGGATLVVGSHAHVIQSWEEYKNGSIFYGLGNTCFGTGDGLAFRRKNRRSLIPIVELKPCGVTELVDLLVMERTLDGLKANNLPRQEIHKLERINIPLKSSRISYPVWFQLLQFYHQVVNKPYEYLFNDQYDLWTQIKKLHSRLLGKFSKVLSGASN